MKRELLTLGVMALFGLSLAGTSKSRVAPSPSVVASTAPSVDAAASATVETALVALPDTSTWKPFTSATARLAAKTPPGAAVTCTKTGSITVCTIVRGMNVFSFSRGGRSVTEIARDLVTPKPGGTTTVLYETADAVIVHRSDATIGEWCEYVTSSEPKLVSVAALASGADPAAFMTVAPKDQDCLDIVAFAKTLRATP